MSSLTQVVSTRCEPPLLSRVRGTLDGADESLLCVAFISMAGVHLLRHQLEHTKWARLPVTTVFGSAAPAALDRAHHLGVEVAVLNPSSGTYHPKLYLARRGLMSTAVIGSANLTGGLVSNVEVCSVIEGDLAQLAAAWRIGEQLWDDSQATPWTGAVPTPVDAPWDELLHRLDFFVPAGSVVRTLGASPSRTGWHPSTARGCGSKPTEVVTRVRGRRSSMAGCCAWPWTTWRSTASSATGTSLSTTASTSSVRQRHVRYWHNCRMPRLCRPGRSCWVGPDTPLRGRPDVE